jgi:hypothetical protein
MKAAIWNKAARLALSAGLLAVTPLLGRAVVRVDHQALAGRVLVRVNNVPVATLVASPKASAQERVSVVERRLSGYAAHDKTPVFKVQKVNGQWTVTANGGAVVSPNHGDAARLRMNRRRVAHTWAAKLKSAWATPFLRLSPGGVVVGVGAARTLTVGGAARGPITVSVDGPYAKAEQVKPGVIRLTGVSPGRGRVQVTQDGATAATSFLVLKPAGSIQPVSVEVTGTAIPGDLLEDMVDSELRRKITLEPGAWSTMKTRPRFPSVWTRGSRLHYKVPVRLAGPGYLSVQTAMDITIHRVSLPKPSDVALYYSNNPETIRGPQVLFWHGLKEQAPARLLYHHQNLGTKALNLAVDITNDGDTAARVQVVDGTAAPSMDTVLVGHQATYKFMKRLQTGTGVIVHIPARSARRIFVRRLNPGDTMSGLMLVRPLNEGKLTLSMRAEDIGRPATAFTASQAATESVFPNPDKALDFSYSVGGAWAYVPIGRYPITNGDGLSLDGNYGVMYTVRLHLENPTARKTDVRVIFEPRAGEARAVFLINGALTETPATFPPAEVRVMTVPLAPRQKKTVTLVTMPAAGGSYPAALIVHN